MDQPNKISFDLCSILKTWIPWRSESANVSRDFWMPDDSCRVCYDCDAQFTLFNRRHHCRLCGRIFCGKCTAHRVPAHTDDSSYLRDEWEKVRACNFCFKQWQQGVARVVDGLADGVCRSASTVSISSSKSSCDAYGSTITICSMSFGLWDQTSDNLSLSPFQAAATDPFVDIQGGEGSEQSNVSATYGDDSSLNQYRSGTPRSDDGDDSNGLYHLDSKARSYSQTNEYYDSVEFSGMHKTYESHIVPDMENADENCMSSPAFLDSYDLQNVDALQQDENKDAHNVVDICEVPSLCVNEDVNTEPVDYENNGLLWLPPEPENEDDDRESGLCDDDDDSDLTGEWGQLRTTSSFGSNDNRSKDKSGEEQKKSLKNVVDGHFRALVSQLLQVEEISVTEDNASENWLEIITALSWEAATLLKPDTSKGGGMDPGGYVKVKCLASGRRSESVVIKGIVCKKNVAHRRMSTRIEKPRVMILSGALEYQRVSNLLSSFHTLLQQEMYHLKMAVAKIDAHRPDILLVEKSVSRYAQEYILAKDISLVLNIKRPLLERIARCTGAQIVTSIDHLSAQMIGYCDLFHVEKCFEDHGSAGQSGKKLTKTLMYFEDCPKPLGCTILLRGANGDELKKLKHVVQYGIFAAYHLALETSFLADERASVPEHLFNESIHVALPNKSLTIERSISVVSGFSAATDSKPESLGKPHVIDSLTLASSNGCDMQNTGLEKSISLPVEARPSSSRVTSSFTFNYSGTACGSEHIPDEISTISKTSSINHVEDRMSTEASAVTCCNPSSHDYSKADYSEPLVANDHEHVSEDDCSAGYSKVDYSERQDTKGMIQDELGPPKEEFPPSPSDRQSILVSLSSRCVWKGTVCERSHLFRIKYYGSFDKPLGRFLQDNLFDQGYRCRVCDMPPEAHVQCYTHRQGTLTISVKKLPEILLSGERDGKIWMWHRCLRCPRTNGFPPATRRVVMSDAAWGLSFGKFLELSFSNHAAASRVASCGHSLHRDCLRFYGCRKMVACFRYASINVYSVYPPPSKVDFNYDIQDWIQKEADEVVKRADALFSEVRNAINKIAQKRYGGSEAVVALSESRHHIAELEGVLLSEVTDFEESYRRSMGREIKIGYPAIDILEINRIRRQLLFQSYMWDHRLVYAASLDDNYKDQITSPVTNSEDKPILGGDFTSPNFFTGNGHVTCEKSAVMALELDHAIRAPSPDLSYGTRDQSDLSSCNNFSEGPDPLECEPTVRRTVSDSEFIHLSDSLDAAWTGKIQSVGAGILKDNSSHLLGAASIDSSLAAVTEKLALESQLDEKVAFNVKLPSSPSPVPSVNSKGGSESTDDTKSWLSMPFVNFYRSINKNFLLGSTQKLDTFSGYSPMYVSSVRDLVLQGGANWLLPEGRNETVIPVYDDEPTSIISYALISEDYHIQLSEGGQKDAMESAFSLPLHESASFHQFLPFEDSISEACRSLSIDESILSLGARGSSTTDSLSHPKSSHIRVSFTYYGPFDKLTYTVTCYYAKHFDALRKICCPSELDFVRSLSRCKKWGAQGGKSNVFFAKTLDDRFIIKQVTKTELDSFIEFAPEYFKYLMESISTKSPTCLAKILGIYQVTTKNSRGKESKMDVLVMENVLFRRNVTRLYDLKGSSRSRYNPDSSGSNKVLLDQNLIEAMPTCPIFVGNKAKRLLERAVWNDTSFLASIDVMDYSLLVGVDEEKHELVLGIIDFMRQYTWDKHLETWVKASGILGGPKNVSPTVISPMQYKKRFRKAMTTYFLMVPDQWSPPGIISSISQANLNDNAQVESSVDS
ncbi:hypothetical protein vseg_004055 [Gypsophila vaccaria]